MILPTMSNLEPMQDRARVGLVESFWKIMEMVKSPSFCVELHLRVLGFCVAQKSSWVKELWVETQAQ